MRPTKTDIKTVTYACKDGYFVDMQEIGDCVEFYFYHEDSGIKMHMEGFEKNTIYHEESIIEYIDNSFDECVERYNDFGYNE